MVHLEDAEAALTAVVRAHRLPRFLPRALIAVLELHVLALERRRHSLFDLARVREGRSQVVHNGQPAERVVQQAQEAAFVRERYALDELVFDFFLAVPVVNAAAVADIPSVDDQR